jgi:ABC-type transporter Mla MlaB component
MPTCITAVSPGIYEVEGDLTFSTVSLLQLPEQLLTSKTQPKIALNKVQHIDSAGLALLIDWTRQTLNNPVIFTKANNQLLRLAKLYNLENTLPLQSKNQGTYKK